MNGIEIKELTDIYKAEEIHQILLKAFLPFRQYYTEGSFNATVLTPNDIVQRIYSKEFEVLIAVIKSEIAGTASLKMLDEKNLYLCSMAVRPDYEGIGIGYNILKKADEIAKQKKCLLITLDTYYVLKNAIRLYERFGFKRNGVEKEFFGVKIFEMIKEIK